MLLKILGEIALSILSLILASGFWSCIKSPSFLAKVLENYDLIKKIYLSIDKDNLSFEENYVNKQEVPYVIKIGTWIKSSKHALETTRNMVFVFLLIVIYLSYLLGSWALVLNLLLIGLPAIMPIVSSAQNNMITDLKVVLLNVYYWNLKEPKECEEFCTKQAFVLKNVYKVVLEN